MARKAKFPKPFGLTPVDREALWINKDSDALVEQYKTYVESSIHVSNWRIAANTVHLTLSSLIISALAYLLNRNDSPNALIITAWAIGLLLAGQWWATITQYRNLNTVKFNIIHELESGLAIAPFDVEWKLVDRGRNKALYWPVSHIERWIPVLVALAESIVSLYGLVH